MNKIITNTAFTPEIGKYYHIFFGEIVYNNQKGQWSAKVRIDGKGFTEWIDTDTKQPLDSEFHKFVVKGFYEIDK